jgi:hypothetical protein
VAIVFFSGFETGGISEWSANAVLVAATDQVTKGGYSGKASPNGTLATVTDKTGLNLATVFYRFNFYCNAIAATNAACAIFDIFNSSGGVIAYLELFYTTAGVLTLGLNNGNGFVQIGSVAALTASAWHCIEIKVVVSTTVGVLELKIDGVVVVTGSSLNTLSANVDHAQLGPRTLDTGTYSSGSCWFDDYAVSSSAYIGPGYCIARQGITGAPTYDAWTKNGAATSALCWSDTPFNASKNCSNVGMSNAKSTVTVGLKSKLYVIMSRPAAAT